MTGLRGGNVPLLGRGQSSRQTYSQKKKSREVKFLDVAASMATTQTPRLAEAVKQLKPLLDILITVVGYIGEVYYTIYSSAYNIYTMLPQYEFEALVGLVLCFFGGFYVTLIAAVEAFRTMGGHALYDEMEYISSQVSLVWEANKEDQQVDADADGIADVHQLSVEELTQRKMKLAMISIDDPKQFETAIGALWSACIAVLATLKLQFAQITAFALAIAEMIRFPVIRATAPLLSWGLGPDLVHWTDTIIDVTLKAVVILFVWTLERIRAAFYSGLRGGKMFGAATIKIMEQHGLTDRLPDAIVAKPFNPDESYLDEVIGYSLAVLGFYFQASNYFSYLPFPLDVVLWPLTLVEEFLQLQVSW
eukprot:TRINITY_DN13046_c1_g1_i2.p1 TRINITY_DN13046_c1_g1~~TRINITY_DN13046_c1_g1_i2.p1  ORF type:complete len:390 (+),score=56.84 TRINITY_DN13046_c1_g1_i2:83-1171(+)